MYDPEMRKDCPMRGNIGNCSPVGGFCMDAVSDEICEAVHNAYDHGFYNALKMLKAQEPRVMTADEVQEDKLVWIEVPQSDEIWPALLRETDWFGHPTWAMRGYALGGYYLHSGYGRDWRCWTAKPTEDQRLAAKWE